MHYSIKILNQGIEDTGHDLNWLCFSFKSVQNHWNQLFSCHLVLFQQQAEIMESLKGQRQNLYKSWFWSSRRLWPDLSPQSNWSHAGWSERLEPSKHTVHTIWPTVQCRNFLEKSAIQGTVCTQISILVNLRTSGSLRLYYNNRPWSNNLLSVLLSTVNSYK